MTDIVSVINLILSIGTIALQAAVVLLIVSYFMKREFAPIAWIVRNSILVAFVLTLSSVVLTLVYSDIFGFAPCGLCWLQRVFLYPQVVLLGIALWYKRHDVAEYIIGLSVFGAIFALYQHYLQMGGAELITCPTTSGGADCTQRFLFEFGYITFPLMSFSAFVFLIVLMFMFRRTRRVSVSNSRT